MFEEKFVKLNAKMDDLNAEIKKLRKENEQLKLDNTANMAKLKDEQGKFSF